MSKTVIYLATVTDQYHSREYHAIRAHVRARFLTRAFRLVEPAKRGWSLAEWRKQWCEILPELHCLVVWPRPDLTIGRGVFVEIESCKEHGVPVLILPEPPWWYGRFELELIGANSYRHWARIRLVVEANDAASR